jgi:tRNA-splicing endonuclease subunit Sen34
VCCVYTCLCGAPTTGDPLRYHSHFVATVQTSPSAPLRPMEVVAHGRLGTATKKAHLLCGWDHESREVTYFSIEWAGFG